MIIEIIKCDKCGKEFTFGNDQNGIPNGVGLGFEDKVVNLCKECINDFGELKRKGDIEALREFCIEAGVPKDRIERIR